MDDRNTTPAPVQRDDRGPDSFNDRFHERGAFVVNGNGTRLPVFAKGNPGRPKGIKNKTPQISRASVKAILKKIVAADPGMLERALLKGLKANPRYSFHFLQMAAHYLDGRPVETIKMKQESAPPAIDYAKLDAEELKTLQALLAKAKIDDAAAEDDAPIGDGADLAADPDDGD